MSDDHDLAARLAETERRLADALEAEAKLRSAYASVCDELAKAETRHAEVLASVRRRAEFAEAELARLAARG